MTVRSLTWKSLIVAAFFLSAWQVLGWMLGGGHAGLLMNLFVGIPLCFVSTAVIGGLIYMRPDNRALRAVAPVDLLIVLPLWALWLVVPLLPPDWAFFGAIALLLALGLAFAQAIRQWQRVVKEQLDEAERQRRAQAAAQRSGMHADPDQSGTNWEHQVHDPRDRHIPSGKGPDGSGKGTIITVMPSQPTDTPDDDIRIGDDGEQLPPRA